ncbi:MAG TPA: vWA domain-containing protein, partial [Planctomycetota bacterium]|nr:vWA domain-containing protein [Planctomycetota bacterium]
MSTWTVAHPAVLLVAPVAILAVVAATRRSVSSLPRWRRLVSGAVRTAAVLLLTFSMVGPSLTQRREQPALTVFLADVSESIPPDAWGKALPELRQAWSREISRGNRCALVAFAGRSQVLVPPGTGPLPEDLSRLSHRAEVERLSAAGDPKAGELRAWAEQIHAVATDFPQALATARALFQEGTTNRIVLVTDGRTPLRAARDIEMPPGTLGIRLEGVPRQDVAVVGVSAPTGVRAGEPFDVGVTLHTTAPGNVSLRLLAGRESQLEMETTFAAPSEGRHLIVLKNVQQKHPFAPGLQPLHVLAQAENDAEPRNNLGTAVVTVSGKPRVLLVEGTAAEAEPLARMLAAQDIDLVREPAARLAERSSFEEFVAVILAGVPPGLLGSETVGTLSKYVAQTGGGLLVAGSTALKGRGYARSEFEKRLLPVAFLEETPPAAAAKIEPKDTPAPPRPPAPPDPGTGDVRQVLSPTLAILFIVDKSGSMTGDAIEIVKKSCIGSAHNLTAKDSMAVIAFDVRPHLILPFTEGDRQAFIEQTVSRLYA